MQIYIHIQNKDITVMLILVNVINIWDSIWELLLIWPSNLLVKKY